MKLHFHIMIDHQIINDLQFNHISYMSTESTANQLTTAL